MRTEDADVPRNERIATRGTDDRASILPFTATLVAALIACAGLAVDGGRILAARREAAAIAAGAARRGSQELGRGDLATGRAAIDPDRAAAAAQAYVAQAGGRAAVDATPERVAVTVTINESTVLLGAFGVGPTTVTATRTAAPFAGGVTP
jgi:Flp pilus assembly protein TadG